MAANWPEEIEPGLNYVEGGGPSLSICPKGVASARNPPIAVFGFMRYALFAFIFLAGCASREPRPNLTLLKWECIRWHDSGEYESAFARAATPAQRTLRACLKKLPANAAVVFDIDETLLSNWPYLRSVGFGISEETFAAWTKREKGIPLVPAREIFNEARAAGIPVFLITGRGEALRKETIRDLKEAGYDGWTALFMKPESYTNRSIIPFKSGVRRMLAAKGYDIILNMGDQESDLAGGFARHRFKLPNPFYYIP